MIDAVREGSTFFKNIRQTKRSLRNIGLASALMFSLSACGVTYFSPEVRDIDSGGNVQVVEMNLNSIHAANSSPYTPISLPQAFYANAGTGGIVGAGAVPPTPYLPDVSRGDSQYRPLPDIAPSPYTIGVGDVLLLATPSAGNSVEELAGLLAATNQRQGYAVRGDGTIAIPNVGTINVAGLTVDQAENAVFQALIENQIDPTFSLEVSEYNSQRVAVGGNVKNAQIVPITPNNLTLGEALIAAGGFDIRDREFANIRVYRDGTLYQIPLVIFDENSSIKDKLLLAGDAVYVDTTYDLDRALEFYESKIDVISFQTTARASALNVLRSEIELRRASLEETRGNFERRNSLNAIDRDYVYLTGEVTEQSRVPLPYEQTASLADVLFGEGGFPTETGNPSQIYVMRASNSAGEMIAYHLDARSAGNLLLATKFQMRPDDVVFIEEQPITRWNRALQQAFPTLINVAAQSVR